MSQTSLMARHQFHRLFPRIPAVKPCRIVWDDCEVQGRIKDVSYGGLGVDLPRDLKWREEEASLRLGTEDVMLRVRPVRFERRGGITRVAFRIERVERGERRWQEVAQVPRW